MCRPKLILFILLTVLAPTASAQQQFTFDTRVEVSVETLHVRRNPGVDSQIIGTQGQGNRGRIIDASPYWSDGYWWWNIEYRDGTTGWSADGASDVAYLVRYPGSENLVPSLVTRFSSSVGAWFSKFWGHLENVWGAHLAPFVVTAMLILLTALVTFEIIVRRVRQAGDSPIRIRTAQATAGGMVITILGLSIFSFGPIEGDSQFSASALDEEQASAPTLSSPQGQSSSPTWIPARNEEYFRSKLERGLTIDCESRSFHASRFQGVTFPDAPCPEHERRFFVRSQDPLGWDLDQPSIDLLGSTLTESGRIYFVDYIENLLHGTGGFGILLIYLERPDGEPILVANIQHQGMVYKPEMVDQVTLSIPIHVGNDPNCCPTFMQEQTFQVDAQGVHLEWRETVLSSESALEAYTRSKFDAIDITRPQTEPARTNDVETVMNEINAIALDSSLSPREQDERFTQLQSRWDAELVATAVRLLPVYDERQQSWRSFDSWAREEAARSSDDAPFGRDPVGSTVNMFFNPSIGNISGQLGIDVDW